MYTYLPDQGDVGHLLAVGKPTVMEGLRMVHEVIDHQPQRLVVDLRQYTAIPRMDVIVAFTALLRPLVPRIRVQRIAIVTLAGSQAGTARHMADTLGLPAEVFTDVPSALTWIRQDVEQYEVA